MNTIEDIEFATAYTSGVHAGQLRKGTDTPYIEHPLAVAGLVNEYRGDNDQFIAALLHDAVEDHGGMPMLDEIRWRFGDGVADIVDHCTDSYSQKDEDWGTRKVRYLLNIPKTPRAALLVCACDKLHNAQCILADYQEIGEALWDRFNPSREQILWYYRALVEMFRKAGDLPVIDELDEVVSAIEAAVLPIEERDEPEDDLRAEKLEIIDEIRRKAELGGPESQMAMAALYAGGVVVPLDLEEAMKWLLRATSTEGETPN